MEYGCLCKLFEPEVAQNPAGIPNPVASRYTAPGNRIPPQMAEVRANRPGTPSSGVKRFAHPVTMESPVGPTDVVNWFPRIAAEGGYIRWVPMQWVAVGGTAMTAPGSPGWYAIEDPHTPGARLLANQQQYYTISDTMTKPAQQLPQYNYASVDTDSIVDRAKKAFARALYGGGK